MPSKRYISLMISAFFVMTLISARFFYFSIIKNNSFKTLATSQQTADRKVSNLRGDICDRNMIKLTNNFTKEMYLGKGGEITETKTPFAFSHTLRYSPNQPACHIIGHTDSDSNGICGIEKAFDDYLKTNGFSSVSYFSDAVGSPVGDVKSFVPENTGSTVVLTIDSHIQKTAEEILKKHISTGAAVILDTQTFDILACVSLPDYDASNVEEYLTSEKGELINRAFQSYDAGSVFKIVTAAAALTKNPEYAKRDFWCGGSFVPDKEAVFECHKKDGHGVMNMTEAFAKSCNCAFYETGLCTGATDICDTARALGFASPVLKNDIGEHPGSIPQKESYTDFETFNLSIGQGDILITPLQCALMCATVANSGLQNSVNLVKSVISSGSLEDTSFYFKNSVQAISPQCAESIGYMMRETVLSGTASEAKSSSVSIAGKTGSAQTGWQNKDGSFKVHGWFCGFFPYENPRYAMTVFAEDGKSGSGTCVKPFVEIAESIMRMFPE